ncbi:MAG TPA: PP2C family protein-serine/threonine phosphatase [Tepidisphaeraceae bacterium]|nr:PP2C family protein-serine/threonine phosphatase [Tepidisphaeraceae bacterium]
MPATATATTGPQFMQCMEVWGGNQAVDSGVVMAGLDAWVYCKPYRNAAGGGDVYYVSSCATGRISRLLVADVSGHGADVAQTAVQLRSLMRRHVNQIDQARFIGTMNGQFAALAQNGCFATAIATTFFAPANHLSLCNAGHPPPLLYRAAERKWSFLQQDRSARESSATNFPLGIVDLSDYAQFDVRLDIGDLVLCYTDSLVECGDGHGGLLGQQGLLEVVTRLDLSSPPASFIASLLRAIEARARAELTGDDVTVLLFRPNGLAPTKPLGERLLAPFRVLRETVRAWRRHETPPWPEMSVANLGGAMFTPLSRLFRARKR